MQNENKISLPEHNYLDSLLCLRTQRIRVIVVTRVSGGFDFNLLLRASPAMRSAWLAHAFICIFILDIGISNICISKIDIFYLGYLYICYLG